MNIIKYNSSKDSTNTRTGDNTTVINGGTPSGGESSGKLSETHLIFGNPFDGTQDVSGDITNVLNITAVGGDVVVKSQIDSDGEYGGNIEADKDIKAGGNVTATKFIGNVEASDVTTDTLQANEGTVTSISGTSLNYDNADIRLAIIDTLQSTDITTENLTVTKLAHFFELIIDKIKAAGGAVILSPADGFKVDKVSAISSGYRVYWKATDGEKSISNMWKVNDLAICQTFNAATGTSYNVSNKYYWSLVTAVGTESIDGTDYHYLDLSGTTVDGTLNPEVGDEIAMLGYRGTDDSNRLSAIYIAAYNSIDSELKAPLFAHYRGINDFNLKAHKYTWFAANGNTIKGNLLIESGLTVEDYVAQHSAAVDNEIKSVKNSISEVNQKAESIESTVASHTTSINSIQEESSLALQTAQGFEQTVKRLNLYSGNNYFGFSKGVSFYNIGNIQPAIKMYGIEVLGGNTLNRIAKLGFNGAKGYFTVTFDARCSGSSTDVNVNLCDVQPYDVNGDTNPGYYTTITTSWKHYVFKFKDLNQYNLASDPYNGFLDFETILSSSLSTNNRLLIKNLSITNSGIELDFSPSAEDLAGNYLNILDAFEYNTTNTVFDNNIYTSIVNPSAPVIVNGVEDTSNTFKDYVGMYNFSVKSNTCYTLVFYAKSDNDGTEIESFLYPDLLSNGVGFDDFYNAVDGRTRTALTTEWKKYYIHWYSESDKTNNINCIVARKNYGDTGYNSTIYITEPELYEGYIPEGWENQSYSKITQRADKIQLSITDGLKETGIDIDEGKITLNADNTIVNGQLQIHNNKNADAIILYDANDNPVVEFKNTLLGDIGNSLKYMSIYTNYKFTSTLPLEPSYLNIIANSYSFNMSSGDSFTLTLNGQSPSLVINGNPLNMSHFNITYTISLCNSSGSTVYTFTSNSSSWKLSSTSYTATSALTGCYLKVICKITENSNYNDWDKLMTMNGNIACSFPIWMEVTGIKKTVIGSDGFASQQDKHKYIKITSDGIVMRWGADGLKLSNNGLERMCYGDLTTVDSNITWGSVNRRNVKVFTSTAIYVNQYLNVDMFIVNTSSAAEVTLPTSGVCEGHTFQVKQVGTGGLTVYCSQNRILNDNTGLSALGTSFNIGTKIWQFTAVTINNTLYWISSNLTND